MTFAIRMIVLVAVLTCLLATQTGCLVAAAAAGTGATVAYVRGDTEAIVDADCKTTTAASEAAAKEMDLYVISSESTSLDGKVVARTARDTKIVVVVKAMGNETSKVHVRVGNFGDEALQQAMLEKIKENLKNPTSPQPQSTTASTTE